ncbi:hypothetical protein SASPL_157690 [Salvia splendens]|uniref:Uncharacterized protein n=1 Tax=Salvia splendens TaxID=180675 RepID=A0A8X8VUH5_SALSN|nr:hypothetical protein SASPL_157690 [Salvia splendens]
MTWRRGRARTPVEGVPNPDGIIGPDPYYSEFNRLGVRVPTLLISPRIDKGSVIHEPSGPTLTSQYEHSSIPTTVKKLFNLNSNFLTKRDAWAGTFDNKTIILNYLVFTETKECSVRASAEALHSDSVLEKLPEVKMALRPRGAREDERLSEYVEDAVKRFLEAGRAALKAGANESP